MAPSSSANKVAKLASRGKGKKVRFQSGTTFPTVVAVVLVVMIALVAYAKASLPGEETGPPQPGDEWAIAYSFRVCDIEYTLEGQPADLDKFRQRLRRQMQPPHAAIGGMRPPLDEPHFLQSVDDPSERNRLDFEQLRQTALMDALVALQIGQNLPLRPRQARTARMLLETLAQQPRNVMHKKTESLAIVIHNVRSGSKTGAACMARATRGLSRSLLQ